MVGTALASFLLFLILHIIVLRRHRAASAFHVLVAVCALFGAIDVGVWLWLIVRGASGLASRQDLILAGAASACLYGLFAFGYVIGWFNLGETARRIRILREFARAPRRTMTASELLRAYDADMIVTARLQRLVGAGQLRVDGGRYTMGGRFFLRQAQMLTLMKVLIPMPGAKP